MVSLRTPLPTEAAAKEGRGGRADLQVRGGGASITGARSKHGGENARGNQTASDTTVEYPNAVNIRAWSQC
jgi:hypothetical protein